MPASSDFPVPAADPGRLAPEKRDGLEKYCLEIIKRGSREPGKPGNYNARLPRGNWSLLGQALLRIVQRLLGGECIPECPIATTDGTRCPDVVWYSDARFALLNPDHADFPIAGEICVEVLSSCNTDDEMTYKRGLLFAAGAEEFWTCDEQGHMRHWDHHAELSASCLCPEFPKQIVI